MAAAHSSVDRSLKRLQINCSEEFAVPNVFPDFQERKVFPLRANREMRSADFQENAVVGFSGIKCSRFGEKRCFPGSEDPRIPL